MNFKLQILPMCPKKKSEVFLWKRELVINLLLLWICSCETKNVGRFCNCISCNLSPWCGKLTTVKLCVEEMAIKLDFYHSTRGFTLVTLITHTSTFNRRCKFNNYTSVHCSIMFADSDEVLPTEDQWESCWTTPTHVDACLSGNSSSWHQSGHWDL